MKPVLWGGLEKFHIQRTKSISATWAKRLSFTSRFLSFSCLLVSVCSVFLPEFHEIISPTSAVGFAVGALSLLCQQIDWKSQSLDFKSWALGVGLAISTLLLGFGFLFVKYTPEMTSLRDVLPYDTTITCLVLISLALVFLDLKASSGFRISEMLAAAVVLISYFSVLDSIYLVAPQAEWQFHLQMKPLSAWLSFLLGWGTLFARPFQGYVAVGISGTLGGQLARRMLPAVFLMPFVVGLFRKEILRTGILDLDFGITMVLIVFMGTLIVLIWKNALALTNVDIERRIVEEKFRKQNETFESTLANMSDGIVVGDMRGNFSIFNPAAVAMTGLGPLPNLSPSMWAGVYGVYHSDKKTFFKVEEMPLYRAMQGEIVDDVEMYINNPAKAKGTWISASARPLKDTENKTVGGIIVLHDITEMKEKENALREKTAFNELLVRTQSELNVGMVIIDPKTQKYTYVNEAACRLLQYSEADFMNFESFFETISPDQIPELRERFEKREAGLQVPNHYQTHFLKKDGTRVAVEVSVRRLDGDRPLHIAVFRDVTERLMMEDRLKASEDRYRTLVNSAKDIITLVTTDGILLSINPAFEELTGWNCEEWIGRPFSPLLHPDERPHVVKTLQALVRDNSHSGVVECRIRCKSGAYLHVESTGKAFFKDGVLIGIIGICRNVTDRKRIEEERRHREELERSNKELEQFAYISSHDLQEPLRMVANFAKLLERRFKDRLTEEGQEYLQFIVEGAGRMHHLINDLLTFSRLNQSVEFSVVDLEEVFQDVLENLKPAIHDSKAIVTNEKLPSVYGNRSQLSQLLQNLVGNAIKFRTDLTPRIHLSVKSQGDSYTFAIKDNGIGFSTTYSDQIFGIFKRLHSKDKYQGSGIGLATCKKVIEHHGGSIWAESEVAKGSTFYFTLPMSENVRQLKIRSEN